MQLRRRHRAAAAPSIVFSVNVVIYVSDALRADHLGCYGARFVNTRTLDELAGGGVRFDQAIVAAPWTAPSLASLVTGLYPYRHGYLGWQDGIGPSLSTVFDLFAAGGFDVASFVFDENYLFRGWPSANVLGTTENLDGVSAWLRQRRERPFFLFVHSWATHMPPGVAHGAHTRWREAKMEYLSRLQLDTAAALEACREQYRLAVERSSEELVASLLEQLESHGLREHTAIVFLGDHGESWGERIPDKTSIDGIYHLHGATLYDEIIHVPLILSAPGRVEPCVVASQVSIVDLPATVLELAGLPSVPSDGISLLSAIRGEEPDRAVFCATSDRGVLSQVAVRRPPWKLIRHLGDGREEAYRLDIDPRERLDWAADAPEELRYLLERELERVEQHELTDEQRSAVVARLTELGYI